VSNRISGWFYKDYQDHCIINHLWEEGPWLESFPEVPELTVDPPATPPDHLHINVPPRGFLWVVDAQGNINVIPDLRREDELRRSQWWSTWWCHEKHPRKRERERGAAATTAAAPSSSTASAALTSLQPRDTSRLTARLSRPIEGTITERSTTATTSAPVAGPSRRQRRRVDEDGIPVWDPTPYDPEGINDPPPPYDLQW